jgi:hypothetical protein
MAKIVKVLRDQDKKRGDTSRVLLNKDMAPNEHLFRIFATASKEKRHQFDARNVSNLTYAHALMKYAPKFDDGSGLFNHIATKQQRVKLNSMRKIHPTYLGLSNPNPNDSLDEFKPQEFKDTVWANATAQVSHPKPFHTKLPRLPSSGET